MTPGQILKGLRTEGLTLERLAHAINERCGTTYDRTDLWKMENNQRVIPGTVLAAWFDILEIPNTKRWETVAARLGLTVPALLSSLGLPTASDTAAPTEAL